MKELVLCGFEDDFIVSQLQGCSRIDWSSHYTSRSLLVHFRGTIKAWHLKDLRIILLYFVKTYQSVCKPMYEQSSLTTSWSLNSLILQKLTGGHKINHFGQFGNFEV